MNIYKLQKINKLVKSTFIKNSAVWLMHVLNRPYLAVFFDPVLSCNLRCRSCYFSNDDKRKELKGTFIKEDLNKIAEAIFGQTLKLQIGCGAEPTIFKHNADIVRLGKKYGIQYISLTTNANLLDKFTLQDLLEAGLDEMTISIHGVKKETYEYLMQNASFEKLQDVLYQISLLRNQYPSFKLRLNYTINNLNIDELGSFFDVFGSYNIDILQLRALRNIGGDIRSVNSDAEFNELLSKTVATLKHQCDAKGVVLIEPDKFESEDSDNENNSIQNASYCYISPKVFWQDDFDWKNENFKQYCKRTNYTSKLFRELFQR